jgi:hypothetical protein
MSDIGRLVVRLERIADGTNGDGPKEYRVCPEECIGKPRRTPDQRICRTCRGAGGYWVRLVPVEGSEG